MLKVAILIEDMVEDVEFLYPYYRFLEEKHDVDVISQTKKSIKGKKGGVFKTDLSISDVKSSTYDIVFISGGYGPDKLRANKDVLDFVQKMHQSEKLIAAICHGPWVLVSAQICKDKNMTSFPSIQDDLKNAGANYTNKPVSVDKNIITAMDPSAMPEMFQEIIKACKSLS
ncbi:MAG: protease [Arcobacter sp.]|uniref:type 1 glutamine amidotransferase domain-containing protein n=1 Tax=uncultured Arcobacter sp. TaxID=165434 RepID=UPI000CC4352B|nr:type 1 glutamine amidotransferase domain-containing protein [uncultured Arcobacter sp.]PLY10328.1 MAG: protease [Arcobacter sp.]